MTRAASLPDSSRRFHQRTTRRAASNEMRGKLNPPKPAEEIKSSTKRPITEDQAVISLSERLKLKNRSVGDVASAGKTTKAAAKMYLQGRAMPRSVALLNMVQNLDEVWEWVVEVRRHAHPESPRCLNDLLQEAIREARRLDGR